MSSAGEAYFKWYYDTGVWKGVQYRGVRTLKSVADMWSYQEIIHDLDVQWIIETGTRHGGSALYFADLLTLRGARGKVVSIDVDAESNWVGEHPKIEFLYGDSAAPDMVRLVESMLVEPRGRLFVILDSDHSRDHVLRELRAYVPLMRSGDYLVVEDTCINGHPVRPEFGPGPWEAVDEFLAECPGLLRHDVGREAKFGFTCAPRGFFVKA
ncbi:MAG: class I SAM-dependent methyltransferase [Burkholderiales bacterium]|nr:class I SAM-dependent methyltransferase [Burkholderiales bacterium]